MNFKHLLFTFKCEIQIFQTPFVSEQNSKLIDSEYHRTTPFDIAKAILTENKLNRFSRWKYAKFTATCTGPVFSIFFQIK